MQIFKLTYLSDEYLVKGYLALPTGAPWDAGDVRQFIHARYAGRPHLAVEQVTWPVRTSYKSDNNTSAFPALLYCRGGIGRVGRVRLEWLVEFARCGYVVFAPCYRGNEGGEGRDEFGGADVEDGVEAFRILQAIPFVKDSAISVLGFSRGSINATLTAVQCPEVDRLILWGGVSDLVATYDERVDMRRMLRRVVGGTPRKVPGAYRDRSPIERISEVSAPVLLVHGTEDVQVDISHSKRLEAELSKLRHPHGLLYLDGFGHHLPLAVHREVVERMLNWRINVDRAANK